MPGKENKYSAAAALLSVLTACAFPVLAAENAAVLSPVDFHANGADSSAPSAVPGTEMADPDAGALEEVQALQGFSMPLANPQSLRVEEPSLPGGRLDLGRFESRASLKFRDGDYAFFEMAVSIRGTDGELRSALMTAEYRPGQPQILDEDAVLDLETRFLSEIQALLEPLRARYGDAVLNALLGLGARYVRTSAEQIPAAIEALNEKVREAESRGAGREAAYPLTQLSGSGGADLSLRKEREEDSEGIKIVESADQSGVFIPRYDSRRKFILTDLGADGENRYFLASVDYRFSTVQDGEGQYRTVFAVSIRYKNDAPVVYSEVFEHGERVEEREFMPKWRTRFVGQTMEILQSRGESNREKVERALFVSYLEPYLYDLYYDFSPSLLKARMAFAGPEVQKEIRKAQKKR